MTIPDFTIDGILPPFVGPRGPGGAIVDMSPYAVTALEVITHFGNTSKRKAILQGWLSHRAAMRDAGFDRGFQWLDGSFVEDKQPRDLDVVTFLYRPPDILDSQQLVDLLNANSEVFVRERARDKYSVDLFAVDLNGSPENIVGMTRYFLSLFSHRRTDQLWKGMLEVRLEDTSDDEAALAALSPSSTEQGGDME